jgi:hypothetical protein
MDIVERLRVLDFKGPWQEAADEIERLRKALKQITEVRYYGPEGSQKESLEMHKIANQALKGGK